VSDTLKAKEPRDPNRTRDENGKLAKLFEKSDDELGNIVREVNNMLVDKYDLNKAEVMFVCHTLFEALKAQALHKMLSEVLTDVLVKKENPQ